jgi:hypothetical protein
VEIDLVVYNSAGEQVRAVVLNEPVGTIPPNGLGEVSESFDPDAGQIETFVIQGIPGMYQGWDGRNDQGQLVDSGFYFAEMTVKGPNFGQSTTFSRTVSVTRSNFQASVDIYNSAGELVWHVQVPQQSALTAKLLSSNSFAPEPGSVLTINFSTGAGGSVTWDGTNLQGIKVQSGTYLVKVTGRDDYGKVKVVVDSVQVLDLPGQGLAKAVAVPNPLPASQSRVTVWLAGLDVAANPGRAKADVYNLKGEAVKFNLSNDGHPATLVWDVPQGEMASGIYLMRINLVGNDGTPSSKTLKLVLIR